MTETCQRIALITGGSRGIGCQTVLTLAARGVAVIFTYTSDPTQAGEVAQRATGAPVIPVRLDVRELDQLPQFADNVQAALVQLNTDRLDYLVNNAGIWLTSSFADTTPEELDRLYAVNVRGLFFLTQAIVPLLRDGGRILNVSSGLVRFTFPMKIAYAMSKGAVEPFSRYLATELAPRGITVNTIAPGATGTDFSGGVIRDNPEYRARVSAMTTLGRPADPDDIAPAIASLLSEDLHWVNGERIEVSGGMRL